MHGELVTAMTEDRLRLHGFLVEPAPEPPPFAAAAVILHGLAGNFYSSPLLLELAGRLNRLGLATLLGNTRGHEFLTWTLRAGRTVTLGAAREDVAECPADISAWVRFLSRRGWKRILLLGHSLGAIKALFSQAWQPSPDVVAIAAASPTRLNPRQFLASPSGPLFQATLDRAQRLVDSGEGEQLIEVAFPFPTWITARAYLDKYGTEGKFDWLEFVDRITVPVSVFFGARELRDNPAFSGLNDELDRRRFDPGRIHRETIPDADHFYTARSDALGAAIESWLLRLR